MFKVLESIRIVVNAGMNSASANSIVLSLL